MTIVEVIQADTGVLTRIDFLPDWDSKLIHSHTVSYRRAVADYVKYIWSQEYKQKLHKDEPYMTALWYHTMTEIATTDEMCRRGVEDLL